MSKTLIVITAMIYTYVFVEQFSKGNTGMGLAYMGYAFANIGLWMEVV
jgi:hypothetical protein